MPDHLERKKQLNLQEQNELDLRHMRKVASSYRDDLERLRWIRSALSKNGIDANKGILIEASAIPGGGAEAFATALWLSTEKRFYEIEALLALGDSTLLSIEKLLDITDQLRISQHERGTGKSQGALTLALLYEFFPPPPTAEAD